MAHSGIARVPAAPPHPEPAFSKKCFQIDPFVGVFQLLAANSPFFTLFPQIFLDDLFFCSTPFFPPFYTPKKFFTPLKIFLPHPHSFYQPFFTSSLFLFLGITSILPLPPKSAARGGPPPLLRH